MGKDMSGIEEPIDAVLGGLGLFALLAVVGVA
jgi:hypothetical protein